MSRARECSIHSARSVRGEEGERRHNEELVIEWRMGKRAHSSRPSTLLSSCTAMSNSSTPAICLMGKKRPWKARMRHTEQGTNIAYLLMLQSDRFIFATVAKHHGSLRIRARRGHCRLPFVVLPDATSHRCRIQRLYRRVPLPLPASPRRTQLCCKTHQSPGSLLEQNITHAERSRATRPYYTATGTSRPADGAGPAHREGLIVGRTCSRNGARLRGEAPRPAALCSQQELLRDISTFTTSFGRLTVLVVVRF
jgi:hypothetical protein